MTFPLDELNTGDILLFVSKPVKHPLMKLFDTMIQKTTKSPFTHTALVLKDPTFISPTLAGLYVWESSWEGSPDPQDGKIKLGVQITPLYEMLGKFQGDVYVRRLIKGKENITTEILMNIHNVVYDKPYDTHVPDWLAAWFRKDICPQKTDRFWCSALVAYFMVQFQFIDSGIDWSIVRPADLSSSSQYLSWKPCCKYSDDIFVKECT